MNEGDADLAGLGLSVCVDHEDVAGMDATLPQAVTLYPNGVALRASQLQ